jgi:oligosaccharyltransferase complex subunit alpha (ribophorin I)
MVSSTSSTSSISHLLSSLLLVLSVISSVIASIPQSFQHTNLLRTIDLTKPYIRDSTALILENTSNSTQTEYYWGIPHSLASKLSYLEVKEKKTGSSTLFPVELADEDHSYLAFRDTTNERLLQVYKVTVPALDVGEKTSLMISSAYVDSLTPYPAVVSQDAKQYLLYHGEKYTPTLYTTLKQKTKVKYRIPRDVIDIDYTVQSNRIPKEKRIQTEKTILRSQAMS